CQDEVSTHREQRRGSALRVTRSLVLSVCSHPHSFTQSLVKRPILLRHVLLHLDLLPPVRMHEPHITRGVAPMQHVDKRAGVNDASKLCILSEEGMDKASILSYLHIWVKCAVSHVVRPIHECAIVDIHLEATHMRAIITCPERS